jgi:unsaturated rhamnogalacturonyl hydrolase
LPNRFEAYSRLGAAFKQPTDDLLSYQAPSGLWKTIIDEPNTYDEVSASAMYLFAMKRARSLGVLDASYDEHIEKTFSAIRTYIDDDHRVMGVSEGTWPGTKEYYFSLTTGEWWWGTGALLLALAEPAEL